MALECTSSEAPPQISEARHRDGQFSVRTPRGGAEAALQYRRRCKSIDCGMSTGANIGAGSGGNGNCWAGSASRALFGAPMARRRGRATCVAAGGLRAAAGWDAGAPAGADLRGAGRLRPAQHGPGSRWQPSPLRSSWCSDPGPVTPVEERRGRRKRVHTEDTEKRRRSRAAVARDGRDGPRSPRHPGAGDACVVRPAGVRVGRAERGGGSRPAGDPQAA
jgi:hypothetical protein